ncbi:MAG: (2Fe-2S) ferredoxin domain-containing protein [Cocleimonas sp.]|nr:(2Fe-2S) ferredoxin domain-containing protein [Cocleimonas sp.]
MSHYQHHVFLCTNLRSDGSNCCQQHGAQSLRDYMKKRSKALGLVRSGQVRINTAGCLNRCDQGPVMVVYPEAVWYSFVDQEDIDDILEQHLLKGQIVDRLNIDSETGC